MFIIINLSYEGSKICENKLPTDYECSETCDEWAEEGHCEHDFQHSDKHRHCTNSTGLIMSFCKKSCNNCGNNYSIVLFIQVMLCNLVLRFVLHITI